MVVLLRRLFWSALLGGAGYAGYQAWQGNGDDRSAPAAPEWPPIDVPTSSPVNARANPPADAPAASMASFAEVPAPTTTNTSDEPRPWVEPVDGACPDGYPIKANDNSGIFHMPGGRFYNRTVPERCYANADDAIADGYRAAKA